MNNFHFTNEIKINTGIKDNYDLELGITLSKSITVVPGSQILAPEVIQRIVDEKIRERFS